MFDLSLHKAWRITNGALAQHSVSKTAFVKEESILWAAKMLILAVLLTSTQLLLQDIHTNLVGITPLPGPIIVARCEVSYIDD